MASDHHLTRTDRQELEQEIGNLKDTVRFLQAQVNNLVKRTPRRNPSGPVNPLSEESIPDWPEVLQITRTQLRNPRRK